MAKYTETCLKGQLSFLLKGAFFASILTLISFSSKAQWLDFQDETDTRLVLSTVATTDDEEKDFAAGDLDKDGLEDVVVTRKEPFSNSTEPPKTDLLLMNVGGVLTDQTNTYCPEMVSNPSHGRDVIFADVDGDTWLDVIVANTFDQQPILYMNQGEDGGGNWLGLLDQSAARFPTLTEDALLICAVWAGDITGNGALDLYFVNYKQGGTALDFLMINDGSGFFTEEAGARLGNLRNSAFGTSCWIEDMDNDGDQDILKISTLFSVSPWNDNGLFVLFNDGTGNFSNWQNLAPFAPYMFEVQDFNQDGMMDCFVVDDGSDYVLLTNSFVADNSLNQTKTNTISGVGGFGGNIKSADFDLDGDLDLCIADVDVDIPPCNSSRKMAILENNNGLFTDTFNGDSWDWQDNAYDMSLVDVNGDGLCDFITGGCSGYNIHMNINCGLAPNPSDYDEDGLADTCDPCPTNPDPGCAPPTEFPTVGLSHTMARQWNEMLLESIRKDFARPTVHARNLFHAGIGMWDVWAAYDDNACTFLLGQTVEGFNCPFSGIPQPVDVGAARDTAIAYMSYRLFTHRFQNSPQSGLLQQAFDGHMTDSLGFDISFVSQDYTAGSAAALGNYMAQCLIDFGLQDGANEGALYANTSYAPVNPPLSVEDPGNPDIVDYNRWQPLTLEIYIDQSGNEIPGETPEFLSPEWGQVVPFALSDDDLVVYQRDGFDYEVYHDPGAPPTLQMDGLGSSEDYQWNFETTLIWSGHLDATDGVMMDISPANLGNRVYPTTIGDYPTFYDHLNGGTQSNGHAVNPATGLPYANNMVPRADYARVLAEFWADGPSSETPPGHWFTIMNYVSDHPDLEKKFGGTGPIVDSLEWDVKSYFALAGAMHDCAVAAWGQKGWYDYLRPISAIRAMADLGQRTDIGLPNYHPAGLELIPGVIESVLAGDPLAGPGDINVGKIKAWAWKGHKAINNVDTDEAGCDWILAESWEPYQRPSFVTPPFAGYVSGHSTFSRAAAVVLEGLTGDEYFPGGMGVFPVVQDEFLVFEDGPSMSFELQWATFRDAADESALSRLWGGIHPPTEDIPARAMGATIGADALAMALSFYTDADADGACDAHDNVCMGDLNNDGQRNVPDLLILLATYGCVGNCVGDFDGNGAVNTADIISYFLPFWGVPCD
jgi:hypothetical protein